MRTPQYLQYMLFVLFICIIAINVSFHYNYAPSQTNTLQATIFNDDYNYNLANDQSSGFFDDISNADWKRSQEIAHKTFPNHYRKDLLTHATTLKDNKWDKSRSNWWNAENFQEEFHCQYSQRIPSDSNGDGPKWVCDPHRIAKQKSCLVYSVGSNGNVMFEKGMKEQVSQDCEIHTFDPGTYNKRNGNFAEALEGYAAFHNWGLDTETNARGKMKTLQQTVKDLGHEGRQIDVFKIDCGELVN